MFQLLILRHAKAAAALPGQRDFDRPLELSGMDDSQALGMRLLEHSIFPDTVLCSPALRTKQTLDCVLQTAQISATIEYSEELYAGEWPAYLRALAKSEAKKTLLIVGHNPSCEDLVNQLVLKGEKTQMHQLLQGFSTCSLAVIEFDTAFSHITPRTGELMQLWRGK